MELVLLFNTVARAELAARIHSSGCTMVLNTASRKGRRTPVIAMRNFDEADVADLNERGYPVKRCGCCK
jgi:hypothetical protein